MDMTMDRTRGMKKTLGGVGEMKDTGAIEIIEEEVEAETVEEREIMGQRERIISTTEGGETAGEGEAPEKPARRP